MLGCGYLVKERWSGPTTGSPSAAGERSLPLTWPSWDPTGCRGRTASKIDLERATHIFNAIGKCIPLDEIHFNAVTALSGSGPASTKYDVQATQNLTQWTVLGQVTTDASGSFQFTDQASVTNKNRSYRLKQFVGAPGRATRSRST